MRAIRAAFVPLLFVSLLPAQTAQQERGKRVIDEALAAMGGPAFLAMEDRVESGRAYSFFRERLSGLAVATIYTRYATPAMEGEKPDLGVRERQAFGKREDSTVLFTGDAGYEITFRGARPLPDERMERYRESTMQNIFYILRLRLNEPGMIFEWRGADVVDNHPVEMVDITDRENRTVTVYFSQHSKLPMRQIYLRRDPKTRLRDEEVANYSKYRDVGGGVMWPFAIQRERNGEKIFEIYANSVEVNQGLKEDLFRLPAHVKVLPLKKR
jgi:hypothetical protein